MVNDSKIQPQLWIGKISDLIEVLEPYIDENVKALAQKAKNVKRQTNLLAGRGLLKYALVQNGWLSMDEPLPELQYTSLNKPYFAELPVHFNLSHSQDYLVLAMGEQPQGVDLQVLDLKRRLHPALVEKVLRGKELEFLNYQNTVPNAHFVLPSVSEVEQWSSEYDSQGGLGGLIEQNTQAVKSSGNLADNQSRNQSENQAVNQPSLGNLGGINTQAGQENFKLSNCQVENQVANQFKIQAGNQPRNQEQQVRCELIKCELNNQSTLGNQTELSSLSYCSKPDNQSKAEVLEGALENLQVTVKAANQATVKATEQASHAERLDLSKSLSESLASKSCLKAAHFDKSFDKSKGAKLVGGSTYSAAAYDFFCLQWTVKECLLKLQGASIFALERLDFDPWLKTVLVVPPHHENSSTDQQDKLEVNPWFKHALSYRLSSLYYSLEQLENELWLTVGVYDYSPQIMVLAKNFEPNNVSKLEIKKGDLNSLSVAKYQAIKGSKLEQVLDLAQAPLCRKKLESAFFNELQDKGHTLTQLSGEMSLENKDLSWFLVNIGADFDYSLI